MNTEQAQCLLGVVADATRQQIVSAHRRLVSTVHPDKCDGPEAGRLARQATEARDVLLAPASSPQAVPPAADGRFVDAVLLRHVRSIVDGIGAPVDGVDLFRIFRSDLKASGLSDQEARVCSARVLDDDFFAAGAARGYWELHGDGVRPLGWVEPPPVSRGAAVPDPAGRPDAPFPDPAADVGQWAAERVRLWFEGVVRWAAAVAAASMFWLGAVGSSALVAGAVASGELLMTGFAVPLLFLCVFASLWIMGRFGVPGSLLGRAVVFVPGLFVLVALLFVVVG